MSLIQAQGPSAALDRVVRRLVVYCGIRADGLPASEHAVRVELAARMLAAVGGNDGSVVMTDPAFAVELRELSLNPKHKR